MIANSDEVVVGDSANVHEYEQLNVADVVEELTNIQHRTENQNLYSNQSNSSHDVQSKDAFSQNSCRVSPDLFAGCYTDNIEFSDINPEDPLTEDQVLTMQREAQKAAQAQTTAARAVGPVHMRNGHTGRLNTSTNQGDRTLSSADTSRETTSSIKLSADIDSPMAKANLTVHNPLHQRTGTAPVALNLQSESSKKEHTVVRDPSRSAPSS